MFFAVVLVLALLSPNLSFGSSTELEYRKLQDKIAEEKRKLSETLERESSVLSDIEDVNRKLGAAEADLKKSRKNLEQTEIAIEKVNAGIGTTKEALARQRNWIRRKLRSMNRLGYGSDTLVQILGSEDPARLMRTWKYLDHITRYEHRTMKAYSENLAIMDREQKKLEGLRQEFKTRQQKVKSRESELAEKKKSKETILHSVRTEKTRRQTMIAELKEASGRMLDIIRESSRTDDYEGKGFFQLKGRLNWPADGKIAVPYGSQKDPQFDTPVFRNGIHIQTDSSIDARAVYRGKIIFAEWFKGFGQLIIINHGSGYHTLYGNLSEIFSKVGDIIKDNQVIGKAGASGTLNAQGIYFEIRYKGKPLDPAQWLKKKKR
jgi:septal ring factor EnvC (AmiA/AmiB activator)